MDQPSSASRPQKPAGPTRKPESTSSAIMSAPWAEVRRRISSLKPGSGGTIPMLAGAGSMMTAAISLPRSAKHSLRAATSLYGRTIVSAVIPAGTPALPGNPPVATPEPAAARRPSLCPW